MPGTAFSTLHPAGSGRIGAHPRTAGPRMLRLAARHADVVGLLPAPIKNSEDRDDPQDRLPEAFAGKIGVLRAAAGDRFIGFGPPGSFSGIAGSQRFLFPSPTVEWTDTKPTGTQQTPMDLQQWVSRAVAGVADWQASFEPFARHPSLHVSEEAFATALGELARRLRDNYPYFHPSYAGQMLKPPHPAAVAGYLAAMLINPNNHALDGGRATSALEKETVAQLAAMFGLRTHLGHLTSSGTIANLEALYVARELHPGLGVAYSAEAHYTHARMCQVLGMSGTEVETDGSGRMDLGALEAVLAEGRTGTVVATAGTTGLGAIDPVHEVLDVARMHGARVHVDAAYGGFFTLLAGLTGPAGLDPAPWRAIAECDSVVVDPHKHGLQPYGCGAVLFRDPAVGRFYRHDSPYTYFTSGDLHLGEISLECSRAGAAAAALWLTFELLPPRPDGLGQVLAAGRRAALAWADLLQAGERVRLYQPPELDIVCYYPVTEPASLAAIDRASARLLAAGLRDRADPVFLSTLTVSADAFARRHPGVLADADRARVLRSVLMKPESEDWVPRLHRRIDRLAAATPTDPPGTA